MTNLRELRLLADKSQADCARFPGVDCSQFYISLVERGLRKMAPAREAALHSALEAAARRARSKSVAGIVTEAFLSIDSHGGCPNA